MRIKLSRKTRRPRKHSAAPVPIPPERNLAMPPTRKIKPTANAPIAKGHKCVARGAFGSTSGVVGGGGGASKLGSWGALISFSYERGFVNSFLTAANESRFQNPLKESSGPSRITGNRCAE